MEAVKPRDLHTAARVADALVYAAGIAGVVAGGLLFRDGQEAFAVIVWVLTFIAGAGLRLASWAARALADLLVRSARIEADVALLAAERHAPERTDSGGPADPYGRWRGWH